MTLKEIAAKAGVSTATVSYVLNNSNRVSDKTRSRVLKIIEETGYRSNMLAKGLRKSRTSLVGVLVEDVTVWHTAYIIDGINHLAEEKGYHTILSNLRLLSKIRSQFEHISEFQDEIEKEIDVLLSMQVDGIIYVGMHDREIVDILQGVDKPVVYCYCYTRGKGSSVRYDNEEMEYQITKLFLEKGHRKFAVLKGREDSEPTHLRMRGIEKALDEAGITLDPDNIVCGNWEYAEAKEEALKLMSRPDCPGAFIAMNDDMAVGIRDAAGEAGYEMPRDISVSGFDNADIVHYGKLKITTVDRPLQEMGYKAMEILTDQIENGCDQDVSITLPCRLIEGNSIRDLRLEQAERK